MPIEIIIFFLNMQIEKNNKRDNQISAVYLCALCKFR